MTDERFETWLDRELTVFADEHVRPVDARALAAEIVAAGRGWRWTASASRVRWLLIAAALIAIAALGAAVAGRLADVSRLGPLAFVRGGDLWVADSAGSHQRQVAVAGAAQQEYIYVLWSPDGRHLAAVRDLGDLNLVPAVEVFDDRGNLVWSKPLEPGGLPDVSWAPDGKRLAIATFPTNVPSEGELLAPYPPDAVTPVSIRVYGLDGTEGRPLRAAGPPYIRPADAHVPLWVDPWIRWSPADDAIAVRVLGEKCCDLELWSVSADWSHRRRLIGAGAGIAPAWFAWRADGDTIDVTGPTGDPDCLSGKMVDGVCTPGFWTTSAQGGSVAFSPLPNASDGLDAALMCSQRVAWAGDQHRFAVGWRQDDVLSQDPLLVQTTASIDVVDRESSSMRLVASGTWQEDGRGGLSVIRGATLDPHALDWSGDGTSVFWMSPNTGALDAAVYAGTVDGAGQPRLVVDGVTQYDLKPGD